jgi:hypothetical protein
VILAVVPVASEIGVGETVIVTAAVTATGTG